VPENRIGQDEEGCVKESIPLLVFRSGGQEQRILVTADNWYAYLTPTERWVWKIDVRELCPLLETVGFNGQTSGKFAPQFAEAGYRTLVLPSTSPAHASLSLEAKLAVWKELLLR
jgi:hypothetical protein